LRRQHWRPGATATKARQSARKGAFNAQSNDDAYNRLTRPIKVDINEVCRRCRQHRLS